VTEVANVHVGELSVDGLTVDALPDGDDDATLRCEDAQDPAERGTPIREELKPLLAHHEVERVVRQVEGGRITLSPLDRSAVRRRSRASHVEHARTQIHPDHGTRRAHERRDGAGDDAGAACEIEHPLSGLRAG
jgi:hypothetical protein